MRDFRFYKFLPGGSFGCEDDRTPDIDEFYLRAGRKVSFPALPGMKPDPLTPSEVETAC